MTAPAASAEDTDLAEAREDLTARLNAIITVLAGRGDVLLKMVWDAPAGTPPGWWDPTPAEVTINGDVALGDAHPDDVDPLTRAGRLRHPVLIGVAAHEGAHSRITRWRADVPDGTPPVVVRVAALLEEPRVEGRQIVFRPGDRLYLRAAAAHLISVPAGSPGDGTPHLTRWQAAKAFTLLCGRAAAGVLDDDDVAPVASAAADVLGEGAVANLAGILREAIALPDGDTAALLDAARRWLDAAGLPETADFPGLTAGPGCGAGTAPGEAGDRPDPVPGGGTAGDGEASGGGTSDPDPVAASVAAALAGIAAAAAETAEAEAEEAEAEEAEATGPSPAVVAARASEAASRDAAAEAAETVFRFRAHGRGVGYHGPPVRGYRPPTEDERAAANQLAAALRRARYRAPAVTRVASPMPPGRLVGRDAQLADAQRHLGIPVTARPFRAKVRRRVDQPPLAVGIAADVSGSMGWAAAPMATASWIIARGAAQIRGRVAAVAFGNRVTPIIAPGAPLRDVPILAARDGEESFTLAIRSLDGALGLSTGSGARLLVIVSDGVLVIPGESATGQQAVTRLVRAGTGILWLDHDGNARVMAGAIRVPLPSPAEAADVIARAAEAALAAA
jgi:hypothetical protein